MTRRLVSAAILVAIVGACSASAARPAGSGSLAEQVDHGEGHSTATAVPTTPAPASAAATPAPTGEPTAAPDADGVVEIAMTDAMRFEPSEITVNAGDSIRFVVTNVGVVPHEAVIGTPEEQRDHAEEMAAGEVHYHSNGVLVEPGETGEFETWFPAGQYLIACHLPGHYEAGMVGLLNVVDD